MDRQQRQDLDRHITGNWGEESVGEDEMSDMSDNNLAFENIRLVGERLLCEEENKRLADFIRDRGYVRCDIPACNCSSFHRGHSETRLTEIYEALGERTNGANALDAINTLITQLDRAVEFRDEYAKELREIGEDLGIPWETIDADSARRKISEIRTAPSKE